MSSRLPFRSSLIGSNTRHIWRDLLQFGEELLQEFLLQFLASLAIHILPVATGYRSVWPTWANCLDGVFTARLYNPSKTRHECPFQYLVLPHRRGYDCPLRTIEQLGRPGYSERVWRANLTDLGRCRFRMRQAWGSLWWRRIRGILGSRTRGRGWHRVRVIWRPCIWTCTN